MGLRSYHRFNLSSCFRCWYGSHSCRLLPDPDAAAVVRHIYALYLQGYGPARIAHILNAEGIPPPSVYRQQHGGPAHTGSGQWSRATLHQMLTTRTYAGDLEQGRRRKVRYKSARSVRLPRSQWIVVPGTHEGLVSRADFAAVQARLARRDRGALYTAWPTQVG